MGAAFAAPFLFFKNPLLFFFSYCIIIFAMMKHPDVRLVFRETAVGASRKQPLWVPVSERAVKAAGMRPVQRKKSGCRTGGNLGGNTESLRPMVYGERGFFIFSIHKTY